MPRAKALQQLPPLPLRVVDNTGGLPLNPKAVSRILASTLGDEVRRRMAMQGPRS